MTDEFHTMTVLIVEDDVLVRMHGVGIFEDAGFRVLDADSADEALVILSDGGKVNLLFSDVDMPGTMDGLALARVVHERWPRIHLLMTSGHHRLRDDDVPGPGRFVPKPWHANALLDEARALIRA
ncbi:response regulator [Sphingomonas sp. XXL09]|uniref:response regulator n=1 Tax=Sphingomonas sp. XXL09 TaxID=3457787 RepID=UPI00406BB091